MTAAILAGGKGRRFIPHKGLLEIDGETIIRRQLNILRDIFDDIFIVTNTPEFYRGLEVQIVSDVIPDKGALGGIYSVLKNSQSRHNFIIASDMPYLNPSLIRYMLGSLNDYDVVAPEFNASLEPLHAFYSLNCIIPIENQIRKNNLRIRDFFPAVKIKALRQKEILEFDPQGLSFVNINTEKDYEKERRRRNGK